MNNKKELLVMDRIFNKMINKMGKYDYCETNLGTIRSFEEKDGNVIEFFDLDYELYRFCYGYEKSSFSYKNLIYDINMSKEMDRLFFSQNYVYNKIVVRGLNGKNVFYDGVNFGYFDNYGKFYRSDLICNGDEFSDSDIINMASNCIDSVNSCLRGSYSTFLDIINANNKVMKRKLL